MYHCSQVFTRASAAMAATIALGARSTKGLSQLHQM